MMARPARSLSENSDKLLGRPRMRAACGVQVPEFTSGACTPQEKKERRRWLSEGFPTAT